MPVRLYGSGSNGLCPHCRTVVHFDKATAAETTRQSYAFPTFMKVVCAKGQESVYVYSSECPNCGRSIVTAHIAGGKESKYRMVHPFNVTRSVPKEVPSDIAEDFLEASAALAVSEKASAALSRRCLQNLLTNQGYKQKDLSRQVDLALKDLPSNLAGNLDAIRNIGNFAAHPLKQKTSGLIVDVEPEEAKWNLDVLEDLFDYYYVQPRKAKEKRNRLNAKLQSIGKPPMKKP